MPYVILRNTQEWLNAQKCHIIIWNEYTMAHKHSLEALNRTLKDLNRNDRLFGGSLILLSGDFRQALPIIPRSHMWMKSMHV